MHAITILNCKTLFGFDFSSFQSRSHCVTLTGLALTLETMMAQTQRPTCLCLSSAEIKGVNVFKSCSADMVETHECALPSKWTVTTSCLSFGEPEYFK